MQGKGILGLPRLNPPDLLLRGGTLLTLDAQATVLRGADLLIRDGRIASLGHVELWGADAKIEQRGQWDDNRRTYWCPACQS